MPAPIHAPTCGPSDWQRLLADPEKHWRRGRSAFEVAVSWEAAARTAGGFPPPVAAALTARGPFAAADLLLAVPERRTRLPGQGRDSQSDVWCLFNAAGRLVSLTVEGKADEGFGATVRDWLAAKDRKDGEERARSRENRARRLGKLLDLLGLAAPAAAVADVSYQPLHRLAAAMIEAHAFTATAAVVLVQAFRPPGADPAADPDFAAFARFVRLFGAAAVANGLTPLGAAGGILQFAGWVACEVADDARVAAAVTPAARRPPPTFAVATPTSSAPIPG